MKRSSKILLVGAIVAILLMLAILIYIEVVKRSSSSLGPFIYSF